MRLTVCHPCIAVLVVALFASPTVVRGQEKPTEDPQVEEYFKAKKWKVQSIPMKDGTKAVQLDTANQALTDDDLKVIGKSKVIQYLSFNSREVTDAAYKAIGGMGQLEYLFGLGGEFTDAGLKAVANCGRLKVLAGSAREVTDDGLKPLGGLKNLTTLRLIGGKFTGTGFSAFKEAKGLEELHLISCEDLTDEGAAAVAEIPNLRELKLSSSPKTLTSAGIRAIVTKRLPPEFEFPKRVLDDELFVTLVKAGWLYDPKGTGKDAKKPTSADKVKELSVARSGVTDRGVKAVDDCVNIEYLFAGNSAIGDGTLQQFGKHKKLKYAWFEGEKITAAGLDALAACPMEELSMDRYTWTDDMCKAVGKMGTLKKLTLMHSKVSADGLKQFATLPQLKELTLAYAELTDESVKGLAGCPALEVVCVNYTGLTDAGILELLKLPKLKSLQMYGVKVKKETIEKAKKDYPKLDIAS